MRQQKGTPPRLPETTVQRGHNIIHSTLREYCQCYHSLSCYKISLSIKDPSKGGKIFTLYHPHFTLLFSNRAFTRYLFLRIAFTSLHHPTRDTHTQPFKCNHNTNPMSDCVLCLPHSSANPSVCLLLSTCNLYVYLFLSAGRDHQHHQHGDGRVGAVPSEL